MSIIYLGGINGSGKTTLASALSQRIPNLQILHGTEELMKRLGIMSGDYQTLRKMPESVKEQAFTEVLCDLESGSKTQITIMTAHYVKLLGGEITPSFGSWFRHCYKLILAVSPPHEILSRVVAQEKGGYRVRELFGTSIQSASKQRGFLRKAQRLSKQVLRLASEKFQVPGFVVQNSNGKMNIAVERLSVIIFKG